MASIIFTTYTSEEFENLLGQLISQSVQIELRQLAPSPDQNQILTRQETAKLLAISLPTLHDYTKRGLIKSHRLGTKVRYKREDIDAALKQIRSVNK